MRKTRFITELAWGSFGAPQKGMGRDRLIRRRMAAVATVEGGLGEEEGGASVEGPRRSSDATQCTSNGLKLLLAGL